jgi:hypothetical protein
MLLPESVTRISTCEVEADVMAADITNVRTITGTYCSKPYTIQYKSRISHLGYAPDQTIMV